MGIRSRGSLLSFVGAVLAPLVSLTSGCKGQPEPIDPLSMQLSKQLRGEVYRRPGAAYALPYRLFVPQGYDAARSYPLVLYLHGAGVWGEDNVRQLTTHVAELTSTKRQSKDSAFVLVPQCPKGDEWVNRHDKPPFHNYEQSKVPESLASVLVFEVLDWLKQTYSIDPRRIYVTGYSMGGSGTWDFVTRHPGVFAAAVPVTGVSDPRRAEAIATLPVWAFHGEKDPVSPASNTREMVERLRSLGAPVRYTELAGVGHDSDRAVYFDDAVYTWLFSQSKPE
ncbi:MAG: prolyl oligopeptidase family serine peptidase [Polyangiaceae bacterium]